MNQYSFLLLTCAVISATFFASSTNSQASERRFGRDKMTDLHNWSIPFKDGVLIPHGKPSITVRTADGEIRCADQRPTSYVFLTRPGESNFVAVLKVDQACPAILYPEGFDYGPIPVSNLNLAAVEQIWGPAHVSTNNPDQKTYRLTSTDNADYFLDAVYNQNKLNKYRVRSIRLRGDATWTEFEKK